MIGPIEDWIGIHLMALLLCMMLRSGDLLLVSRRADIGVSAPEVFAKEGVEIRFLEDIADCELKPFLQTKQRLAAAA